MSLSTSSPSVKVEVVEIVGYCLLLNCQSCKSRFLLIISFKVQLFISYQVLLLLFHYFRTIFASTWRNDTTKFIVNTTIATTLSTSRKLQMKLLIYSAKWVSSVNQGTRNATEFLNWLQSHVQLRQDRSVHAREILLVPSPDEGGGNNGMRLLQWTA